MRLRARLRNVADRLRDLHHGVAAALLWVQPALNIHGDGVGSVVLN